MLESLPLPLKGVNFSYPLDQQDAASSPHMYNVRPFDTLERRIRLGQRPGMDKAYTQQIGGASSPIVWIGEVTIIAE